MLDFGWFSQNFLVQSHKLSPCSQHRRANLSPQGIVTVFASSKLPLLSHRSTCLSQVDASLSAVGVVAPSPSFVVFGFEVDSPHCGYSPLLHRHSPHCQYQIAVVFPCSSTEALAPRPLMAHQMLDGMAYGLANPCPSKVSGVMCCPGGMSL